MIDLENEFKDLSREELINGYICEGGEFYRCIFCGKTFEEGVVYSSGQRQVDARRAACEHVHDIHGGSFLKLLNLEKQVNGLTDIQKSLLRLMYEGKDNKEISQFLNISLPTVRTHKFNIQKMKREAKILLALLEFLENPALVKKEIRFRDRNKEVENISSVRNEFKGNTLHPFFSNFNLK